MVKIGIPCAALTKLLESGQFTGSSDGVTGDCGLNSPTGGVTTVTSLHNPNLGYLCCVSDEPTPG